MDLIFLMCTERCGSNLLTRMMDAHPEVAGPPPTHAFRTFSQNLLRYSDLSRDEHWLDLTRDLADLLANQLGAWKTTAPAAEIRALAHERSLAAALRFVYEREALAHGKRALFIKENQTYRFLPYLLQAFPGARFVYLVRDPRDMALSYTLSPNHPGDVREGARIWRRDQEQAIACYGFLKPFGRIHLLRYEDLIAAPETELCKVCAFLGLPFSEAMLRFHEEPSTRVNAARLRDWENLSRPVMSQNKRKYRAALSEAEIRCVEGICRTEMEILSYPLEYQRSEPVPAEAVLETGPTPDAPDAPDASEASEAPAEGREAEIRARRIEILNRILSRPRVP